MNKIAIFDFDGTITPYNYPKYQIFKDIGINEDDLMKKLESSMHSGMNVYESFCSLLFKELSSKNIVLNDENISRGADSIEYNKGIIEFLEMLKTRGYKLYIVSSGMEAYLKHTVVAKYFDGIYGTNFNYENDVVCGIKTLVTDEKKNDIIEGILAINYIANNDCQGVYYFGDGYTDYNAMRFIKNNGGTPIFIASDEESINIFHTMKKEDVVDKIFANDYSSNGEIYKEMNK